MDNRREVVDRDKAVAAYARALPPIVPEIPAYLSLFGFPPEFAAHLKATGSVGGYSGPVGVPEIAWDIDQPNLGLALQYARRLTAHVADRFGVDVLVCFSGSKGFHVSIPLTGIAPDADNPATLKAFCARIANGIGVEVDLSIYNQTRLWRAVNSQHPTSELYKVRIDADDLLHLTVGQVKQLAAEPRPFEPPARVSISSCVRLLTEWQETAQQVCKEQGRVIAANLSWLAAAGVVSNGTPHDQPGAVKVNPLTRSLLTNPVLIEEGHRAVSLFSAAANLASFPSVEELVTAILTEPGLDMGLPPHEVARQIQCGITKGRNTHKRKGDPAE
jgi:hypothetical protein